MDMESGCGECQIRWRLGVSSNGAAIYRNKCTNCEAVIAVVRRTRTGSNHPVLRFRLPQYLTAPRCVSQVWMSSFLTLESAIR